MAKERAASSFSSIIRRWVGRCDQIKTSPIEQERLCRFSEELRVIAPPTGRGDYVFHTASGERLGFAQITATYRDAVTLHRVWVDRPGSGHGTAILRILCELADRHGIGIIIKPLPFGQKPYPLSRGQLMVWYSRHGFEGTHRKMARMPQQPLPVDKLHAIGG